MLMKQRSQLTNIFSTTIQEEKRSPGVETGYSIRERQRSAIEDKALQGVETGHSIRIATEGKSISRQFEPAVINHIEAKQPNQKKGKQIRIELRLSCLFSLEDKSVFALIREKIAN